MNRTTFTKTHFMFSRVDINIDIRWRNFEKKHKGWMAAVVENILIGLTHRMRNHFVADTATIDKKVLQICLTAGESGQANPAP